MYVPGACETQKRSLDALELELWMSCELLCRSWEQIPGSLQEQVLTNYIAIFQHQIKMKTLYWKVNRYCLSMHTTPDSEYRSQIISMKSLISLQRKIRGWIDWLEGKGNFYSCKKISSKHTYQTAHKLCNFSFTESNTLFCPLEIHA